MYDWANSAFATTIMAAVLPAFYSAVACSDLDKTTASSYWGYTNTAAMLIIAVSAPVLGAAADYSESKKKFLGSFMAAGVLATALLFFVDRRGWFAASLLYVVGRIGFSGANIFYDSLLPHITDNKSMDSVSARGFAYGYAGGGLLLLINLLMITKPGLFGIPDAEMGSKLSFLSVALWWLLFSMPFFLHVPEPHAKKKDSAHLNSFVAGFKRLRSTFGEIKRYNQLFRFLIAFWLYNDGIGTIIVMAVIFGAEIGIGQTHLIGAILLVQFAGAPFSLLFGKLSERLGTKNCIFLTLAVYTFIAILGYFMTSPLHFWVLAFLVATVQGGSQALSRSMFGAMVPREKSAEFFGFYSVSSKFAGIIGPFVFAALGQATGSSRFGILALVVFFVSGALCLLTVDHEEGIRSAQAD